MTTQKLAVLLALLPMAGCYGPALRQQRTNNAAFDVHYLFTHEGCRVYRFIDAGPHYFVRCDPMSPSAPQASTTSIVGCGKNCSREEQLVTSEGR
jgi:hypothetical protein